MSSRTRKQTIKNEVEGARRRILPAALNLLNTTRIVPTGVGSKRTYEMHGPNGSGAVAYGIKGIVNYLRQSFPEIQAYIDGGKSRWLTLSTSIAAYLHYAEERPKLEHLRGTGPKPWPKPRRSRGRGSIKAADGASVQELVREELLGRLQRMPTSKLIKLLQK